MINDDKHNIALNIIYDVLYTLNISSILHADALLNDRFSSVKCVVR